MSYISEKPFPLRLSVPINSHTKWIPKNIEKPQKGKSGGNEAWEPPRGNFIGLNQHLHSHDQTSYDKKTLDLRKGIFPAEKLVDYNSKDYPFMDSQCVIRFPSDVAQLLRNRLEERIPLGLNIIATNLHDYRFFEVKVDGVNHQLEGILLELPTLIESYKTLDGDLMFKSADISQILIVYFPNSPEALNIPVLKDMYNWEWKCGLTPATRNIRRRKYKNFNVFDKQQILNAELEVIELLTGLSRDSYEYVAHSEYDMMENSEKFQLGESNERVITVNDDLKQFLEDGAVSDASDEFFGLPHTPWASQDAIRPPGTARIGRPRRQPTTTPTTHYNHKSNHTQNYLNETFGLYQKYHDEQKIKVFSKYEKKLIRERKRLEKFQKRNKSLIAGERVEDNSFKPSSFS